MSWSIIAKVQQWLGNRKCLLRGLVGVAVEEAVFLIPGPASPSASSTK